MLPRTYPNKDPLATALEAVGDRWTLLILREVALGNGHFNDICNALVIPRSSLNYRLRRLAADGLVVRVSTGNGRACFYMPGRESERIDSVITALEMLGSAFPAPQGNLVHEPRTGELR